MDSVFSKSRLITVALVIAAIVVIKKYNPAKVNDKLGL
jgi:hypothetical protein